MFGTVFLGCCSHCHMVFLSPKLFLLLFLVLVPLKSCFLPFSWGRELILLENKSMSSYQPPGLWGEATPSTIPASAMFVIGNLIII